MVNKAINSVVELQWQEDISISSTLKYINPESLKVGRAHHVWSSVRNSVHDSRRAQLKSRLLTGTYTLQSNRAVFNQFAVDPTCKLCEKSPETRQHFLAECQTLHRVRQSFCNRIQVIVDHRHIDIASPDVVTQLILDPSLYLSNKTDIDLIELYSRELISSLHRTRNKLLSSKEKQQSLAISISKISRANFSRQQKNRKQIKKSTSNRRFAVKKPAEHYITATTTMAASMKLKNREIFLRILATTKAFSTTVVSRDVHKTSKMMQKFLQKKQRSKYI